MTRFVFVLLCAAAFGGSAAAQQPQTATANFVNAQGDDIGTATLTETLAGVLISLDLRGLPSGEHAFHVHEKGVCNPGDKFASAGGHLHTQDEKHGYLVADGPHEGDMPNMVVALNGTLRTNVLNTMVTLTDREGSLFGPDGSSLVIHDRRDDYKSQPSGDAGDRIACAVIKR